MARIEVRQEREIGAAWLFDVEVEQPDSGTSRHVVRLSWADYDHWSHGSAAPSRVVERLIEFVLKHNAAELLRDEFDAAIVRVHFPDVDRELPRML